MVKNKRFMNIIKYVIVFLIPIAAVMVCNNGLNNDSWFVLAEGREIVENGIYYEDQLSMHEGLNFVVQNYGFAVIFYLIYSVFGPVGIYIGMLILNLILCYLIYKICMLLSNRNVNLSLLIMVVTDLLLGYCFVVTRAQMVSYCILMLVVYLLELYIRTNKNKYLYWIPLLSFLQINLHASIWPMMFIVMAVYIIDSFKNKKLHLQGYRRRPLFVVLGASLLVGFLNPYGIRMMTFIFTSYGIPEANNFINEMKPFSLVNNYAILLYGVIAMTMILYIFGKNKNIRIRWLIMIFGFLALGINSSKGMSYLILTLLFPLAAVYKDVLIEKWGSRKMRWMVASWCGVLAVVLITTVAVVRIPQIIDGPNEQMIKVIDELDIDVGEMDKKTLKIYADYNQGGFLEYRGYKPYIDPRMETFLKVNNGKEDIFIEFYDLVSKDIEVDEFIGKYDFDYLVVMEYEDYLYDYNGDDYKMIYEIDDEEEDTKNGVRIYKKI